MYVIGEIDMELTQKLLQSTLGNSVNLDFGAQSSACKLQLQSRELELGGQGPKLQPTKHVIRNSRRAHRANVHF